MKEWAESVLNKADRLLGFSLNTKEEDAPRISLYARNTLASFCYFVEIDVDKWFLGTNEENGFDLDLNLGKARFSFEFQENGGYRWSLYSGEKVVSGGGENHITQDGVDSCFGIARGPSRKDRDGNK